MASGFQRGGLAPALEVRCGWWRTITESWASKSFARPESSSSYLVLALRLKVYDRYMGGPDTFNPCLRKGRQDPSTPARLVAVGWMARHPAPSAVTCRGNDSVPAPVVSG
jgi:hypothetical protein